MELLYRKYNQQKIESFIRTILDRYRSEEERNNRREAKNAIINVVLTNSIVPSYYLEGFFEFIYDIYKINFVVFPKIYMENLSLCMTY